MEGWKEGDKADGRMEGRMEGWKDARIEGKTEGWKSGSTSSQPCAPKGPADFQCKVFEVNLQNDAARSTFFETWVHVFKRTSKNKEKRVHGAIKRG